MTESKSVVLPLHHTPKTGGPTGDRTPTFAVQTRRAPIITISPFIRLNLSRRRKIHLS